MSEAGSRRMIGVYNKGKYSSAAYRGYACRGQSFFTKFRPIDRGA
jgi:hypothetical protein